jgi:hypothetical protein
VDVSDDIWYESWFYNLSDVERGSVERSAIVACMRADADALRALGPFDVECADRYAVRMRVDTGSEACLLELLRRSPGTSLQFDNHWPVRKAVYNGDCAMLECLLRNGAVPDVPEAMRDASCEDRPACLRVLLRHGAKVEAWMLDCARRFGARGALLELESAGGHECDECGSRPEEDVRGADPVVGVAPLVA